MTGHSEGRQVSIAGLLLASAALLGTLLLAVAENHSAPLIAENRRQAMLDSLRVLIPAQSFDNDILNDVVSIGDPELLGTSGPTKVFRARWQGTPSAVAFRIVAPDGYSGDIEMLMAVRADGVVSGVRVLSHRETPGLGDEIEVRRSDWILGFNGRSRRDPTKAHWRVVKDGGDFDQFTGATITPRAVVKAVHKGLLFFERYRDQLFNADLPVRGSTENAQRETG